ncbi:MAG: acetyltransferase MshD [Actinomycetota bacterium]
MREVTTTAADDAVRAAVLGFCDRVSSAHGHSLLSDHLRLELADGDASPLVAIARGGPPLRPIIGVAVASEANRSVVVEVATGHLHDEPTPTDLVDDLVTALVRRVRERDDRTITWWIREHDGWADDVARRCGFREDRHLLQMRVELRPELIEQLTTLQVETRGFRPGVDDAAWLSVNNRAFGVHGEQGSWDKATLGRRLAADWFDPDGFRLHERSGRLAAFCWTKMHAATAHDPALGEIYVIAVDPDFAGSGLGRALTASGLVWIADRGVREAMLYVDEENTAAVSLYRSLGMETHHVDRSFVLDRGRMP